QAREEARRSEIAARAHENQLRVDAATAREQAEHMEKLLLHVEAEMDRHPSRPRMEPSVAQQACMDLLHAIIGYAEMILEESAAGEPAEVRADAERIKAAALQLLSF